MGQEKSCLKPLCLKGPIYFVFIITVHNYRHFKRTMCNRPPRLAKEGRLEIFNCESLTFRHEYKDLFNFHPNVRFKSPCTEMKQTGCRVTMR